MIIRWPTKADIAKTNFYYGKGYVSARFSREVVALPVITVGTIIRLRLSYKSGGTFVTGLVDLTVTGRTESGSIVINQESMVEGTNEYYYDFIAGDGLSGKIVTVEYQKAGSFLIRENIYIHQISHPDTTPVLGGSVANFG